MKRSISLALAALAPALAVAGMYDKPWSIVEASDRSPTREEMPASITQIDGKSTRSTRRPDPVEPGKHTVRIRFSTAKVQQSRDEEERELEMTLEPCTRYRIAARRTEGTQWVPQVYAETIGECKKKFKL